jgi:hypothetical protein
LNKKIIITTSLGLVVASGFVYFSNAGKSEEINHEKETSEPIVKVEKKEFNIAETTEAARSMTTNIETIATTSDFSIIYKSIDELMKNSDLIIEGVVMSAESMDYTPNGTEVGTVLTKAKVKVIKSFNDTAKKDDIVTFIEPGGVTTKKVLGLDKKMKLTETELNDKVQVISNGVPNLKRNDKVLLFGATPKLDKGDVNVVPETHYWVLGAHQGKFKITETSEGTQIERTVPESMVDLPSLKSKIQDVEAEIVSKSKN